MVKQRAFLHAFMFIPAPLTLIKAVESGFLTTFPGLTMENIRKYLPKLIETTWVVPINSGRIRGQQGRRRSSLRRRITSVSKLRRNRLIIHNVYADVIDVQEEGTIYTDRTKTFPAQSS